MNGEEFLMQSVWQMLTALILLSIAATVLPYLISKLLSRGKEKICKCGQRVSSSNKFCPNCGLEIKKFASEKGGVSGRILWLIVLLILLVFLILFFYLVGWNFLQNLMKRFIPG